MRLILTILAVLSAGPVAADECDALAARIVAETPMRFDRRTDYHINFNGPAPLDTLTVHCPEPGYRPSVGLYSRDTALPPPLLFDTVAVVTALALGLPREKVRADAILCQQRALKDVEGDVYFDRPGYQTTCAVGKPSHDPAVGSRGFLSIDIFKTR